MNRINNMVFFLLCVLLALVNLYFKLNATPEWFNGTLQNNHALLLSFNYANNEQSRLLQFYIPEFLVRTFGFCVINAYIIQRFIFTLLTFFLFFLYAKKWFNKYLAIICVIIMAAIMPPTYRTHLQESAPLLSLTFLCALWAIRENKTFWYVFILLVGSINNETMLFVPAVYFFVNFIPKGIHISTRSMANLSPNGADNFRKMDRFQYKGFDKYHFIHLAIKTVLLALPAFVIVGIIRYINIDRPHLGGAWHFYGNISDLYNLHTLLMSFNIFWLLAFLYFKKKPLFLQRALLTIPLFIIPHLITGIIRETRQMIPLAFIIIPASMFTLIELNKKKKKSEDSDCA